MSAFGRRCDLRRDSLRSSPATRAKLSEVPPHKFATGSGLQITFKTANLSFRAECDCRFDFPWSVLHRMNASTPIVLGESCVETASAACVMQLGVRLAHKYVNIVEAIHQAT
jgi:hypothetical protein